MTIADLKKLLEMYPDDCKVFIGGSHKHEVKKITREHGTSGWLKRVRLWD